MENTLFSDAIMTVFEEILSFGFFLKSPDMWISFGEH